MIVSHQDKKSLKLTYGEHWIELSDYEVETSLSTNNITYFGGVIDGWENMIHVLYRSGIDLTTPEMLEAVEVSLDNVLNFIGLEHSANQDL